MRVPQISLPPAARGVALTFAALALGALLNAQGLRKSAEIQPPGLRRDVATALARPLARASSLLYLDRPRRAIQVAIGRADEDRIDLEIAFALPPPARPRPGPLVPEQAPRPQAPRPKPRPRRAFTPAHPLRVWIAGDSLVEVPGQALVRATGSAGSIEVLDVESRLGTGLGQPAIFNWFTRIRHVIRDVHPHVAVLSFGADDAHDYLGGAPQGRRIGKLGSPTWTAEYRRRVEGVTRELSAAGIQVVWIGLPITAGPGFRRSFPVVNRVLRDVAARHPARAFYVDTWSMFVSRRGRYTDYLRNARGRVVLVRAPDGVHYEPPAGDMIARAVLARLNRVFDLTSWRRS